MDNVVWGAEDAVGSEEVAGIEDVVAAEDVARAEEVVISEEAALGVTAEQYDEVVRPVPVDNVDAVES